MKDKKVLDMFLLRNNRRHAISCKHELRLRLYSLQTGYECWFIQGRKPNNCDIHL